MGDKSTWTGERLETFIINETMLEHLHRYAIAMEFTKGKKVLDIACGEGYGVNLLSQTASHVTGVDVDDLTIKKASKKYAASNISFKTGSALNIPAEAQSFEIITCFETLEHLSEHDAMLSEFKRILIPGGLVLISTPEKSNYSDKWNVKNPFHKKEFYEREFKTLLSKYFTFLNFYRQTSFACSIVQHEKNRSLENIYSGNYDNTISTHFVTPMYWIAIASDKETDPISSSIFHNQQTISELISMEANAVKKTITYRLGNLLLSPLKFIRTVFKK